MPVKEWFRKLQPMQLYIVLTLTIAFFLVELFVSHVTHALTLLMDSYHMLCNIFALAGCIVTIKHGHKTENQKEDPGNSPAEEQSGSGEKLSSNPMSRCGEESALKPSLTRSQQERKLRNTFGWARIDIIAMLFCCVFLASLCFSILVEAMQTLVHIGHHDEMHHPIPVLCVGGTGILLNGICFLLIGGYTFHQGSFLYVTKSGDVVLDKVVISNSISKGERRLSRTRLNVSSQTRQRQGAWEMLRDVVGCFYVIICAIVVYMTDKEVAKYVDPVFSMLSALSLIFFSYPYMKESCLILLQTIPDSVDIESLKRQLLKEFPDIMNIHDFHVWELTANKVISTVHIIFQNPKVYESIVKEVKEFFIDNGITQVTIQPEFYMKSMSTENLPLLNCLMQCQGENCKMNHCCPTGHSAKKEAAVISKASSKEKVPANLELDLKSIKILDNDAVEASVKSELSETEFSLETIPKSGHDVDNDKELKTEEDSITAFQEASEESSLKS